MSIKISIITVVRNAPKHLESTIENVLAQTYENIEYIVIDGDSDDETLEVIRHRSNKISKWISEHDSGVYYAMNKSLSFVTGDWIIFLNAGDTFISNETIENVVANIDSESELVYGDAYIVSDAETRLIKANLNDKIFRETPICHQSLFVRADIMKDAGFNEDYSILADYSFILDSYINGRKFQYLDFPISNYLLGGMSAQNIFTMYIEGVKLLSQAGKKVNEINIKNSSFYKGLVKHILDENQVSATNKSPRKHVFSDYIKKSLSCFRHKIK